MSDALCGPSNAVQNLAKHSSVDRTLQQDRLVSRQSPSQGFRSHDPNVASLDPEFEAFQNGHALGPGPAFAGPSWSSSSFSNLHSQTPLQAASSAPPTAWTRDFQRLSITSPQQALPQAAPQAWHNHFGQHAQPSAPLHAPASQMQFPSARFQSPLAFNSMHATPQYASQSQYTQQQQGLPQDQFDEAAFEAAFDAALQDASMDQDATMQDNDQLEDFNFEPFAPDLYPHLPLFRLALADALVTNTDESLHKAAKVVAALIQHPRSMDPIQAMLFRPLLSALNDPKRTLFAQRYGYEPALHEMLDALAQQTENTRLNIDATTERLLASYADLLWQRTESNHLNPTDSPRTADNAHWLGQFFRDQDSMTAQNITQKSANLLTGTFQRHVISDPTSQALSRVLDLEHELYSERPALSSTSMPLKQGREAMLFDMMERVLSLPETLEALEASDAPQQSFQDSLQKQSIGDSHALEDYQHQLRLLEQQNAKRHWLNASLAQGQEHTQDGAIQPSGELYGRSGDLHEQSLDEQSLEDVPSQQTEQERQEQRDLDRQNDDELAQTAANLLERVSDNQSSKFKNSAFLGLMRQLADREVRVEGDKMVPTNGSSNALNSDSHRSTMAAQDGQEVVDLLKQPNSMTDQDHQFMMTSPFATADDY
ncbi:hypothetical protein D6C78_01733 [Aureobasidium pullulans]|uniref:Uncharacterized protein n=1 Tax=Aureobasidium pullulans TaxID=5580 RepID=A0A4V4LFX4_AURPU|nr:hypothetical protein D6D28_00330 [Aureobasidium pullulans]THW00891.1 hypothetical protein D6D27_00078 [Aureobasidium pullulans]TIA23331.1 hypothetical protein D6C81_02970 [Aureobasidium pullulans]TIA41537.1 hypothetical protein D6C78_01733 [Aureobasidium pullulans]